MDASIPSKLVIRIDKKHLAIAFFQKAYRQLTDTDYVTDVATIYLNLCVIYSSLCNHVKAIEYSTKAIKIALSLIFRKKNTCCSEEEEYKILYLGYYNLAVEYEFMGNRSKSLSYYKQAQKISKFTYESDKLQADERQLFASICSVAMRNVESKLSSIEKTPPKGNKKKSFSMNQIEDYKANAPIKHIHMLSNNKILNRISFNKSKNPYMCYLPAITNKKAQPVSSKFNINRKILSPLSHLSKHLIQESKPVIMKHTSHSFDPKETSINAI